MHFISPFQVTPGLFPDSQQLLIQLTYMHPWHFLALSWSPKAAMPFVGGVGWRLGFFLCKPFKKKYLPFYLCEGRGYIWQLLCFFPPVQNKNAENHKVSFVPQDGQVSRQGREPNRQGQSQCKQIRLWGTRGHGIVRDEFRAATLGNSKTREKHHKKEYRFAFWS